MNTPLGPSVPFVNVEIGATDRGDFDSYKNLVATISRNFNFADLRARRGFRLYYCEHSAGHGRSLVSAYLEVQTIYSSLALGLNPPQRRVTCPSSCPGRRSDTTGHRASRSRGFAGYGASLPGRTPEGRW